jgi:hypothetical protein
MLQRPSKAGDYAKTSLGFLPKILRDSGQKVAID